MHRNNKEARKYWRLWVQRPGVREALRAKARRNYAKRMLDEKKRRALRRKMRRYYVTHKIEFAKRARASERKATREVSLGYAIRLLTQNKSLLKRNNIPEPLAEVKRAHILVRRLLKEVS